MLCFIGYLSLSPLTISSPILDQFNDPPWIPKCVHSLTISSILTLTLKLGSAQPYASSWLLRTLGKISNLFWSSSAYKFMITYAHWIYNAFTSNQFFFLFPVLVLFILQDPPFILLSNFIVNFASHIVKTKKNKTISVFFPFTELFYFFSLFLSRFLAICMSSKILLNFLRI